MPSGITFNLIPTMHKMTQDHIVNQYKKKKKNGNIKNQFSANEIQPVAKITAMKH